MSLLIVFLLLLLFAALTVLRDHFLAIRCLERLEDVPLLAGATLPMVSIIIPACNEERDLEQALSSILALDYPNLEIIALDDRSTDATPEILDRMASSNARLRVIHIKELPAGWLGKNHALHIGAQEAQGEFLLFTDADIHMASDTIRRAAARMEKHTLDQLCLYFRFIPASSLLAMLFTDSLSSLISLFKPWLVSKPDSRYFIGAGGFNMVRRSFYSI